ncbi:MAG TPA: DUF6691 family protein [Polyangia bacterium]
MKGNLAALAAGALFALGLVISGMTRPEKVIGLLDVRQWDASLGFVMLGAISAHAVLLRLINRRSAPVFVASFKPARARSIDARLLAGSAIFGLGWGLSGYCPGPAIVALGGLNAKAVVFVVGMTAGMLVYRTIHQRPTDFRARRVTKVA